MISTSEKPISVVSHTRKCSAAALSNVEGGVETGGRAIRFSSNCGAWLLDDPAFESNRRAWQALAVFERPWLTVFSDMDPLTRAGEQIFQKRIKGALGQPHVIIKDARHFLQEDKGPEVAKIVVDFVNRA
jgi:pimeloyl-ACP methyl ester carboxylesterase